MAIESELTWDSEPVDNVDRIAQVSNSPTAINTDSIQNQGEERFCLQEVRMSEH